MEGVLILRYSRGVGASFLFKSAGGRLESLNTFWCARSFFLGEIILCSCAIIDSQRGLSIHMTIEEKEGAAAYPSLSAG